MRRIAPNERPEHSVEIGYLRDLTIAIKWDYYGIGGDRRDVPPLNIETVGMWQVHRRALTGCHNFKSLELKPRLSERGIHETEIIAVDNLLVKIMQGLSKGNPTGHIDSEDILALERAYRALGVCKSHDVWY